MITLRLLLIGGATFFNGTHAAAGLKSFVCLLAPGGGSPLLSRFQEELHAPVMNTSAFNLRQE
jgi:hypothetical protein